MLTIKLKTWLADVYGYTSLFDTFALNNAPYTTPRARDRGSLSSLVSGCREHPLVKNLTKNFSGTTAVADGTHG